jgi:hypothetical protein
LSSKDEENWQSSSPDFDNLAEWQENSFCSSIDLTINFAPQIVGLWKSTTALIDLNHTKNRIKP